MIDIKDVTIDPELREYLRLLSGDERELLVESVKKDGFTDPIIVWLGHGIVVDGHNRHSIWNVELEANEDLAPQVIEKRFDDKTAVKEWMLKRQLGKRNLTDAERVKYHLLLKPVLVEKAKANLKAGGTEKKPLMNSSKANTRKEIAKQAGVSEQTVSRVEKVLKDGDEKTKADMLSGETSVNAAHKTVAPKKPKAEKPKPPEPVAEKPSSFDPATFDESMNDQKPKADDSLKSRIDDHVMQLGYDVTANLKSLENLMNEVDQHHSHSPTTNHKSFCGFYRAMHNELTKASETIVQIERAWKSGVK